MDLSYNVPGNNIVAKFARIVVLGLGIGALCAARAQSNGASGHIDAATYQAAEKLNPFQLLSAIKNPNPRFNWIGQTDWAWYRRDTHDGFDFQLIDASTGQRHAAFDHAAVAEALRSTGEKADASNLPITDLRFSNDRATVVITTDKELLKWNRDAGVVTTTLLPPNPHSGESVSPDKHWAAFRRNDNLWIRNLNTGEEHALTSDGAPYYSYGKLPDDSLIAVKARRTDMVLPPVGLLWSPDSSRLIVPRVDERKVRSYTYLQSVPPHGWSPIPYVIHRALLGDAQQPVVDLFSIDVATDKIARLEVPANLTARLQSGDGWWSSDLTHVYSLAAPVDQKSLSLLECDIASGQVRTVIKETAPRTTVAPYVAEYNAPNVRILGGGKEVLWFSERDGWGHLYLYDGVTGILKRQLTGAHNVVFDIIAVDEKRRVVFFTGSMAGEHSDPYQRMLYRVPLDGGVPVRLTPEGADHQIDGEADAALALYFGTRDATAFLSPDFRYFVDTASTVAKPPVTLLRSSRDGHVISLVETADTSQLDALGYEAPEPFIVKAADGTTDIVGVLYWPPHHTGTDHYPVIDAIYNGVQVSAVPHTYTAAFANAAGFPAALARLGFAVIVVDGRGTAMRDKEFHDFSYGNIEEVGLVDHIAALKQLAQRYPELDLTRVGTYGASFGGYYAARAILAHPDVFKAAFAVAGPYDYQAFYANAVEALQGLPIYSDGGHVNPTGMETPVNYASLDLTLLARNLRGKLALVTGDMDENAPPAQTFQMANALERAGKEFDLIVMPNHVHAEMYEPYVTRRMWDFFVRNLQMKEPPDNLPLPNAMIDP
jgi:dipeptidyl-peptidase 4